MRYFDRTYRLRVGAPGKPTLDIDGSTPNPARITFNVYQGTSSYVTTAMIAIYGLQKETRQKAYEQYSQIYLEAGYKENSAVIFTGSIYNVEILRQGPENIVRFFCRSAANNWENAFINKTYGAGTPMGDVIQDVARGFGAPVDMVGDFSTLPSLQDSLPVSMDCKRFLNMASDNFGLKWGYESGKVSVYKDDGQRDGYHVTSGTTGMVGTPRIRERGIDVTIKINPAVRIYDRIEVQNQTGQLVFNNPDAVRFEDTLGAGIYKIQSYNHVGDMYGDTWDTIIEGLNTRVGTAAPR